jgi:L-threonylcarbamoyladenylate synthase
MQPEPPPILSVDPAHPSRVAIASAVAVLRSGGLVVLPTDTVYGVAADPRVPGAEERLCAAKGRDRDKPIPLLIDHVRRLKGLGVDHPPALRRLAARFWPGPLTAVIRAGDRFEGVRIPDHPVTLAVLRAMGVPLRVTSANQSGEPPACTAADAVRALGGAVALALDAGPAPIGEASTVVKLDGPQLAVVRAGAIPEREIRDALAPRRRVFVCSGNICRSPMAEYLMRRWLGRDSGWAVSSAGTSAVDGMSASVEAVRALAELKIDLRPHRSRQLTGEIVDAASLIVVMTAAHRTAVLERFPGARDKAFALKSFGGRSGDVDVEDPIGAPLEGYRKTRDEINAALPDLILFMHEREQRRPRVGSPRT